MKSRCKVDPSLEKKRQTNTNTKANTNKNTNTNIETNRKSNTNTNTTSSKNWGGGVLTLCPRRGDTGLSPKIGWLRSVTAKSLKIKAHLKRATDEMPLQS